MTDVIEQEPAPEQTSEPVAEPQIDTRPFVIKVRDEVKRLAETYPDFVYKRPGGEKPATAVCSNVDGGDPKYPELRGCIVGQAVRNLGCWIPAKLNRAGCHDLLRHFDSNLELDLDCLWLITVQNGQDDGMSWKRCIDRAAIYYADETQPLTEQESNEH